MNVLRSALELLGIVLLRFRMVPRIWAVLLILINLASIFFLDSIYGQVALAAVVAGVIVMIVLYSRYGFVRLLGIGHIFWIPMLIWLLSEIPFEAQSSFLTAWLWCLIVANGISLLIDTVDVARYVRGERKPYYTW